MTPPTSNCAHWRADGLDPNESDGTPDDDQHLDKAVTIGETTRGGAHRVMPVNAAPTFVLLVPFSRPMNVVTGGGWEGTGVVPDIKATAEKALATAHLQAIRKLPSTGERQREIERLQRELGDPEK
jgi:hypothetical protein